ncbi:MAG: hypothetical protein SVR81_02130 [Chloroflexota bacterium]|nr:hypothetical protein [Chloroflexota bacterium]
MLAAINNYLGIMRRDNKIYRDGEVKVLFKGMVVRGDKDEANFVRAAKIV